VTPPGIVIVGAGQAGFQAAVSLRDLGHSGDITLINGEGCLPYQRPPLSKAYMLGKIQEEGLRFRHQPYFEQNHIRLVGSDPAVSIDRTRRTLRLVSGTELHYDHLILATGTRNRTLDVEGTNLEGVHSLRTIEDAVALRSRFSSSQNVVVIGGGFIGMEFAAVAARFGVRPHVIETAPRIMARAASPEVSAYFTKRHKERGTTFAFNESVVRIVGKAERVIAVETAAGKVLPADLVVVGVGVIPNVELAQAAGLQVGNGVVVDEFLRTSDPAISAVGDCAVYPSSFVNGVVRLESVQNAIDQARTVAARIMGKLQAYAAVPWFWSDQGDDKLQIAGIASLNDLRMVKGDESGGRFSVFFFRNDVLACVESVNRVADHMAARTLLKSGRQARLTPQDVRTDGFDLKSYVSGEAVSA
jgi:3-phenylpropionate/trans-cinnamate dioxygenase ferredoxin reductase component